MEPNRSIVRINLKQTLITAIRENSSGLVKRLLLNPDLDVNSMDFLFFAVSHKRLGIVGFLLKSNVEVDKFAKKEGISPLMKAVADDSLAIADLLLKFGADPNLRCLPFQKTCIFYTKSYDMVKLLIKYGANVNALNGSSVSPLLYAICEDLSIGSVELLIKHGADVNYMTPHGETPLMLAVVRNMDSVVRILLHNGANKSVLTSDGCTLRVLTTSATTLKILERADEQPSLYLSFYNNMTQALTSTGNSVEYVLTAVLSEIPYSSVTLPPAEIEHVDELWETLPDMSESIAPSEVRVVCEPAAVLVEDYEEFPAGLIQDVVY